MRSGPLVGVLLGLLLSQLCSPDHAEARRRRGRRLARQAPVPMLGRDGKANVLAHSFVVADLESGEEILARNADEVRAIASLSKLTAAMAVLDANIQLESTSTITEEDRRVARGGAKSRLLLGMTFTNRDLLHAALLASDNRAIPALGRAAGMTPHQLTSAMNEKAKQLGLRHTHFEDPTGLNPGNVSTAREMLKVLKAALGYPLIAAISRKPEHDVTVVDGRSRGLKIRMANTDRPARAEHHQILGGKTGYNDIARYCLVVAAKVCGREIGMAFLGSEGKLTRFGDYTRVAKWLEAQAQARAPDHAAALRKPETAKP